MEKMPFSEGDLVVLKDKVTVGSETYRGILENGKIYSVVRPDSSGGFYILECGKLIKIYSSDVKHFEHIRIIERVLPKVGRTVYLKNLRNIEGAEELGFQLETPYEIIRVLDDNSVVVKNDSEELWIIFNELINVEIIDSEKEANQVIDKLEELNLQHLIDKALDERDFDKLKELHNLMSESK